MTPNRKNTSTSTQHLLLKALLLLLALPACAPRPIIIKNFTPPPLGKTGAAKDDCLNMTPPACKAFKMINNIRANQDLPPLIALENCIQSAVSHSNQMDKEQNLAHNSKAEPWTDRIKRFSAMGESMAENIGLATKAERMVDLWMKSKHHKKNILTKNFNYTGIALTGRYWTQCFLERVSEN